MKQLKLVANLLSNVIGAAAILSLLSVTLLPSVLGYKTYVVLSGSMEPSIRTGAVVFALTVPPDSLKVGDVIVYNRSDVKESVTHRILQVNQDNGKPTFITKGDANGAPDSWTVQYSGDTAGKIVFTLPLLGYAYHGVGSPPGRILFLVVPIVVLTLLWLCQIWRPQQKSGRIERELPRSIAPAANSDTSEPPQTAAASKPASVAAENPQPCRSGPKP